jgi:glutathione S-transferase
MSLALYFHPLSSFCHKALIALYENDIAFTPMVVDLSDETSRDAFRAVWPVGKFPVLRDGDRVIPESTSIIEYLALYYPGPSKLIPADAEAAVRTREIDRFYDLSLHVNMQKIIGDRWRPAGQKDPHGVAHAKDKVETALALADKDMAKRSWAAGEDFTMADCAAAPPLFYCDMAVEPLAGRYDNLAAYLDRLKQRPSYVRTLKEAEPFMHMVPR